MKPPSVLSIVEFANGQELGVCWMRGVEAAMAVGAQRARCGRSEGVFSITVLAIRMVGITTLAIISLRRSRYMLSIHFDPGIQPVL